MVLHILALKLQINHTHATTKIFFSNDAAVLLES